MKCLGKCLTLLICFSICSLFYTPALAKHIKHKKPTVHKVRKPAPKQSVIVTLPQKTAMPKPLASYTGANFIKEINRIIASADPYTAIGVQVTSMKYGDTLYARNDQQFFIPASTLKVLTAEAALLYLRPDFKFHTRFLTDATSINDGVLQGNLYLVQTGDPTLTFDNLVDLVTDIKSHQITRIAGNLYIDTSAYDQVNFGPGWLWKDERYCYGAPINASIINRNCLPFKIVPAKISGAAPSVIGNPRQFYSGIKNSVVTQNTSSICYMHLGTDAANIITIRGCMPQNAGTQGASAVVTNVMQYNLSLAQALFIRYGISIQGRILSGTASANLSAIADHESQPLQTLVTDMLKMSDNIIAGSLFKKIGQLYSNRPGSWANGGNAVKQILAQAANVNTAGMNVLDGSGLSRYNRISPAQMMQVLNFSYHNQATNYAFISALPIAGVDGTLKRRLQNVAGKVHAKTGTMADAGVFSLAGYTVSKEKEPLAFVIMINARKGEGWKYKELENQIVTVLTKYSRS